MKRLFLLALLYAVLFPVLAQKVALSGVITDAYSGEQVTGAYVILTDTANPSNPQGCVSNKAGFYSVSVYPGSYQLKVSFVGYKEINEYVVGSFDGISAFSIREDAPEKASRPFDRDRDGLVPSGGAATVIIESEESALKRGAKILGEVVGYGFSSNGDHISVPNVDGPARSIKMALRNSGMDTKDIGYINAHATSTLVGDQNEAKAIYSVFGDDMPPVTSTKSQTGHEMWMAGASEVIYSMLMMENNFVAANLNFENPDEDTKLLNIPAKRIENYKFDAFLSNSFGFGGTNSTLILKRNTNKIS